MTTPAPSKPHLHSLSFSLSFFSLSVILLWPLLLFTSTTCSSQFTQGYQSTDTENRGSEDSTADNRLYTRTFTIGVSTGIDEGRQTIRMLWLMSNDLSMDNDQGIIDTGIRSFTTALRLNYFHDVNLKATLVTGRLNHDHRTWLEDVGVKIYKKRVEAHNALSIAQELLKDPSFADTFTFNPRHINVLGVVTDQQSNTHAQDMHSFLKSQYSDLQLFRFYGFIDSSVDTEHGGQYSRLASTMKGEVFDVLNHDSQRSTFDSTGRSDRSWAEAFQDVEKHIRHLLATPTDTLLIPHEVSQITEVRHNDEPLAEGEYRMEGSYLKILVHVQKYDEITVSYYARPQ